MAQTVDHVLHDRLIGFELDLLLAKSKSGCTYRALLHVSLVQSVQLANALALNEFFLFLSLLILDKFQDLTVTQVRFYTTLSLSREHSLMNKSFLPLNSSFCEW